jgi:hypothetical protein
VPVPVRGSCGLPGAGMHLAVTDLGGMLALAAQGAGLVMGPEVYGSAGARLVGSDAGDTGGSAGSPP